MVKQITVTIKPHHVEAARNFLENHKAVHCFTVLAGSPFHLIVFKTEDSCAQDIINELVLQKVVAIDILKLGVSVPKLEDRSPPYKGPAFLKGLYDRMTLEEIFDIIDSGSTLSFDFLAFAIVAAWIAATGLLSNSAVVVVAAMLVSPLMGPIIGLSFSLVTKDAVLRRNALKTELVGALTACLVGVLAGILIFPFSVPNTDEMTARGHPVALIWGFFVAFPSGAGIALAIVQGGVNSLVGVAISASLLPPIVNAGINLAFGIIDEFTGKSPATIWHHFEWGLISLLLYCLNVTCIITTSYLVFKIKGLKDLGMIEGMGQQTVRNRRFRFESLHWPEMPSLPALPRLPLPGFSRNRRASVHHEAGVPQSD